MVIKEALQNLGIKPGTCFLSQLITAAMETDSVRQCLCCLFLALFEFQMIRVHIFQAGTQQHTNFEGLSLSSGQWKIPAQSLVPADA